MSVTRLVDSGRDPTLVSVLPVGAPSNPMHYRSIAPAAVLASLLLSRPSAAQGNQASPTDTNSEEPDQVPPKPAAPVPPAPAKSEKAETSSSSLSSFAPDIGSTGFMIYLTPISGLTYRPKAVPRDEVVYGSLSTRAGVILRGRPYAKWRFTLDATLDGSIGKRAAATPDRTTTEVLVQEASITYLPFDSLSFRIGRMRMPFSPSQSVIIPGQLFPNRPTVTNFFFLNADDGIVAEFAPWSERLRITIGGFDGSSLVDSATEKKSRGVVGSARIVVEPLGAMSGTEGDYERGPFRFALGSGAMFRPGKLFDDTGYGTTGFDETRMLGFVRASFKGFFIQSEILRRRLVDRLSLRPRSAWGGYVEASYYAPVGKVGFAPVARGGYHVEDAETVPARTTTFEGGLSFFPEASGNEPDALRFTLLYAYENRSPFPDPASSFSLAAALRF